MSLLFAQKHPELVRGVVVGGVWGNTAAEVKRYLGPDGTKALIPGANKVFDPIVGDGKGAAGRLHRAIRDGIGGKGLAFAYGMCEGSQAQTDIDMRQPFTSEPWKNSGKVIMASSVDPVLRFSYIESEMMWRGEQGKWRLNIKFPRSLKSTPLIVIQGRFDQVCDPIVAVKVHDAWPGTNKLLIPMNASHGGYMGITEDSLKRAGAPHDPESVLRTQRAMKLYLGDPSVMHEAAIEFLIRNEGQAHPK
jgi:pimeloyl-ACP methyl ester carboxylesterase